MKSQKWMVTTEDNDIHTVEYSYSFFTGKYVLKVDGDSFAVQGLPFKIKIARREIILVGGMQAVLEVDKKGKAALTLKDAEVVAV